MNIPIDQLTDQAMALVAGYGMNALGAIVTLIVGFAAAGRLARLTNRAMAGSDKIDAVFQPIPGKIVRIVVMVFTVIAVLNRFAVQTTSLIAVLGAAGLSIGLALQGTLSNVAAGEPRILDEPPPLIKVDPLGDSAVNILFRVWTARTDWWDTKLDLVQRCKEALEAGGISIPFPQRDVHLIGQPLAGGAA